MKLKTGKIYSVGDLKGILEGFSECKKNAFLSFCDDEGKIIGGGVVMTVRKLKKLNNL